MIVIISEKDIPISNCIKVWQQIQLQEDESICWEVNQTDRFSNDS